MVLQINWFLWMLLNKALWGGCGLSCVQGQYAHFCSEQWGGCVRLASLILPFPLGGFVGSYGAVLVAVGAPVPTSRARQVGMYRPLCLGLLPQGGREGGRPWGLPGWKGSPWAIPQGVSMGEQMESCIPRRCVPMLSQQSPCC